jgi:ATP-dependent DNA helicase RecG
MLRVFVSSVQKELEDERLVIQNLINTDPFLSTHCLPVLYEYEPASAEQANEECLKILSTCQAYLLIIWREYGRTVNGLPMTHREYRLAKEKKLPALVFIRGERNVRREEGTQKLINEIEQDRFKYKRFGNVIELQKEVRVALVKLLRERFSVEPSSEENLVARQNIEATSPFESQSLTRLRWEDLDHSVARRLVSAAEKCEIGSITDENLIHAAIARGLIWRERESGIYYATAAGIVLLSKDPSAVFPQCRILADAYRSSVPDGDPRDHEDIRAPMPFAVERAIAFVDRNTRHPMRVVGINRLRLDEYPTEALREGMVNAMAHRLYEDAGRKVILEVFPDRVVIFSPGLPPAPLTVPMLRSGRYRPCSRNPVLAQCLSFFHRIEERGYGFRRMQDAMQRHGLDPISLGIELGYFQLVFPGPGDDLSRLRVPHRGVLVPPEVEAQLTERQKRIIRWLLEAQEISASQCQRKLRVSRPVITADLGRLIALDIIYKTGAGPATRYRLRTQRETEES